MPRTDETRDTARRARLRQELSDEGYPLGEEQIDDLILEELSYARYVSVHEGIFPNYGALIGNEGTVPPLSDVKNGSPASAMRKFADGENSFVIRRADAPESVALVHHSLADERAIVDLCADTESVFVQRLSSGAVTITSRDRILINEGHEWRARPVASTRTHVLNDILQLSAIEMRPLFSKLLDFAFHQLSPQHIGATLVVDMQSDTSALWASLGGQGSEPPFELNLSDEADARAMVSFLRVVDGACLVASDGRVVRCETKLQNSDRATDLIRPEGGMRHSSAKWFSYDHPEVVIIVVSADGPVSLFSNGVKIAIFDEQPTPMLSALDVPLHQRAGLTSATTEDTCDECNTVIRVDTVSHPDSNGTMPIVCPVCGNTLSQLQATQIRVYPAKPWFRSLAA